MTRKISNKSLSKGITSRSSNLSSSMVRMMKDRCDVRYNNLRAARVNPGNIPSSEVVKSSKVTAEIPQNSVEIPSSLHDTKASGTEVVGFRSFSGRKSAI